MPRTIRAFIAVELPAEVKQALAAVSHTLAEQLPPQSVRWVQPQKMHLTLRFLGDTAVDKLDAVTQQMDTVTAAHAPFTLQLNDSGCFPNRKRPRVIWVGVKDGKQALLPLKRGLDTHLQPLGWPPENKPFQGHLTLGRVKDGRGVAAVSWEAEVPALSFPVTGIHLIESRLTPQGPIYTVRHTAQMSSS